MFGPPWMYDPRFFDRPEKPKTPELSSKMAAIKQMHAGFGVPQHEAVTRTYDVQPRPVPKTAKDMPKSWAHHLSYGALKDRLKDKTYDPGWAWGTLTLTGTWQGYVAVVEDLEVSAQDKRQLEQGYGIALYNGERVAGGTAQLVAKKLAEQFQSDLRKIADAAASLSGHTWSHGNCPHCHADLRDYHRGAPHIKADIVATSEGIAMKCPSCAKVITP